MWYETYYIAIDYANIAWNEYYHYSSRAYVISRRRLSPDYVKIVLSHGLGVWILNITTNECIRAFKTLHRREYVLGKVRQMGIPVRRLYSTPF